jgi:hypothetical protein
MISDSGDTTCFWRVPSPPVASCQVVRIDKESLPTGIDTPILLAEIGHRPYRVEEARILTGEAGGSHPVG